MIAEPHSALGGAIVLAAGASSRMGTPKALLTHADGRTFLRAACESLAAAGLSPVVVVLGNHRALLEKELSEHVQTAVCSPRVAVNPAPERGQISSMAVGLGALLGEPISFALIALVDQPALPKSVLARLIDAASREPEVVHIPLCRGVRGHPAAFPISLAKSLAHAGADESARDVIERLRIPVREHPVDEPAVLLDLDTPEELAAWRQTEAR